MGVLEIISGVLLILCSIAIIVMVLFQESKGNGLSGAIAGGEMMGNEGRSRSSNAMLAKYTKYAAIVFFVLAILVGVISIYLKKARQLLAGFFAIYLRRPGKSIVMCVE